MGNGLTLGNIGRIAYEFGYEFKTIRRILLALNPYFVNEI